MGIIRDAVSVTTKGAKGAGKLLWLMAGLGGKMRPRYAYLTNFYFFFLLTMFLGVLGYKMLGWAGWSVGVSELKVIYTVGLSLFIFHTIHAISLVGVHHSDHPRASLHNLWWPIKTLALLMCMLIIYIFARSIYRSIFYLAATGGFLFLLVQAFSIISLGYEINQACVKRVTQNGSKAFLWILVLLMLGCLGGFLTWSIFVFFRFANSSWFQLLNLINMLLLAVQIILVFVPGIRACNKHVSVLPPLFIALYGQLLLSSGFEINSKVVFLGRCGRTVFIVIMLLTMAVETMSAMEGEEDDEKRESDAANAGNTLDNVSVDGSSGSGVTAFIAEDYNYCLFHVMFALGSLALIVVLTDWTKPTYFGCTELSVYSCVLKVIASVVTNAMVIWTIIAPAIMKKRNFD